jgi:hypothetical protein
MQRFAESFPDFVKAWVHALNDQLDMILNRCFTDSIRGTGFLSKVDRCKTFDKSAYGYVRAEGGGLVLPLVDQPIDQVCDLA